MHHKKRVAQVLYCGAKNPYHVWICRTRLKSGCEMSIEEHGLFSSRSPDPNSRSPEIMSRNEARIVTTGWFNNARRNQLKSHAITLLFPLFCHLWCTYPLPLPRPHNDAAARRGGRCDVTLQKGVLRMAGWRRQPRDARVALVTKCIREFGSKIIY